MIDMTFSLYELERDNKSRAIALISGDRDFGHLLGKIHHTPPVSNLFLILLRQCQIDRNLSNVVDKVIQLNYAEKSDNQSEQKQNESKKKKIMISLTNLMDITKTFQLKTSSTNNAENIKQEVFSKNKLQNANKQQLVLLFNGKELKKTDTLKKCGVRDGDGIMWYFNKDKLKQIAPNANKKKSKKICLKFQNLSSDQIFELNAKRSHKIYYLKQEIYTKHKETKDTKLSMEEIVIYHEGKELMEMQQINSYDLKDGDTLIWYTDQNRTNQKKSKKEKKKKLKIKISFVHQGEPQKYDKFELESTVINSIFNLKTRVAQKYKLNQKEIEFIFKETILCDKKTLKNYNITSNAEIIWTNLKSMNESKNDKMPSLSWKFPELESMIMPENKDPNLQKLQTSDKKEDELEVQTEITVIVQHETKTHLFTMNENNLILDLKDKIKERLSINPSHQTLTFKGQTLNDYDKGHILNAYGFADGDTIHLNVNMVPISFDVEVLGSEIIKNLSFVNKDTVSYLKEELFKRCGLMPSQQILTFDGNVMSDSYSLYRYGISKGSLIKLNIKDT